MYAKKSLGQNFLMHAQTAERIVEAAGVGKDDVVLEVGPGTGMLTRVLLARAKQVIAVETDHELIPVLRETFAPEIAEGRFTLIEGDIRTFDFSVIPAGPYMVVANIPYYITGELFRFFLAAARKPASLTVLVQKEVAERIARSKKGSLLSVSVKTYGTPKYCFTVPRGAFVPAPNVDSAVLNVSDIHNPFVSPEEEQRFFDILHAGFGHKRKMLAKNLEVLAPREKIHAALVSAHLQEKVRAEDVSIPSWKILTTHLHT